MILRSAAASPFGRKVTIAVRVLGLDGIDIVPADPSNADDPLRRQNPLGKIPTLILDDGSSLYDSRVIVEYLDHLAGGGRIIPADPRARFPVLKMQALADGLMDASILQVYESRWRDPSRQDAKWLDHQGGKVERALAELESAPPSIVATPDIGQIAVACALGYRDLRFAGSWREKHPRLVLFLDAFAASVPAFGATKIAA